MFSYSLMFKSCLDYQQRFSFEGGLYQADANDAVVYILNNIAPTFWRFYYVFFAWD